MVPRGMGRNCCCCCFDRSYDDDHDDDDGIGMNLHRTVVFVVVVVMRYYYYKYELSSSVVVVVSWWWRLSIFSSSGVLVLLDWSWSTSGTLMKYSDKCACFGWVNLYIWRLMSWKYSYCNVRFIFWYTRIHMHRRQNDGFGHQPNIVVSDTFFGVSYSFHIERLPFLQY